MPKQPVLSEKGVNLPLGLRCAATSLPVTLVQEETSYKLKSSNNALKIKDKLEDELSKKVSAFLGSSEDVQNENILVDPAFFHKYFEVSEEECAQADWRHIAGDIAWGDATWMMGSEIFAQFFNLGSSATIATNVMWPFTLAALVLGKYFYDQVQQVQNEKGRPATSDELKIIRSNTIILGCKVFASVAGWEIASLLAPIVCEYIVKAGVTAFAVSNPCGHILMGAIIGLGAGLGVVSVNLFAEGCKGNFSRETVYDSAKLFAATFAAGAAWYWISIIPVSPLAKFLTPNFKENAGNVAKILGVVTKSLAAYVSVKFCFHDIYKRLGGQHAKHSYSKDGEAAHNYYLGTLFGKVIPASSFKAPMSAALVP